MEDVFQKIVDDGPDEFDIDRIHNFIDRLDIGVSLFEFDLNNSHWISALKIIFPQFKLYFRNSD